MSNPKVTAPGWPDPTDWVNRLYQEMMARQANYDAEDNPLLQRNKAGGMLGLVVRSLNELPPFADSSVHLPLKDLLIFLNDLDIGRSHLWSRTGNVFGTNITPTAKNELKAYIRAIHHVQIANGFKKKESYERIAKTLADTGRTGHQGEPIPWRRVAEWCRDAESPRDQLIREKVEGWWAETQTLAAQAKPHSGRKPITEKQLAGEFGDSCLSVPHLRDRSVSDVS